MVRQAARLLQPAKKDHRTIREKLGHAYAFDMAPCHKTNKDLLINEDNVLVEQAVNHISEGVHWVSTDHVYEHCRHQGHHH